MLQKLGKQSLEFLGQSEIAGAEPDRGVLVNTGVSSHAYITASILLTDEPVISVQIMSMFSHPKRKTAQQRVTIHSHGSVFSCFSCSQNTRRHFSQRPPEV